MQSSKWSTASRGSMRTVPSAVSVAGWPMCTLASAAVSLVRSGGGHVVRTASSTHCPVSLNIVRWCPRRSDRSGGTALFCVSALEQTLSCTSRCRWRPVYHSYPRRNAAAVSSSNIWLPSVDDPCCSAQLSSAFRLIRCLTEAAPNGQNV